MITLDDILQKNDLLQYDEYYEQYSQTLSYKISKGILFLDKRIKGIINFVKNCYKYRTVLYRDRNWDYGFLVDIVEAKIQAMRQEFSHNPGNTYNVKNLDAVLVAIDNWRNFADFFEMGHQERLQFIDKECKGMKPDDDMPECVTQYIQDLEQYEKQCWDSIWDRIKDNGIEWVD